jgi:hypothetical protein
MELDSKVRKLAKEMSDGRILAKLSCGDMVAIEAKYQLSCLRAFYNKHRSKCQTYENAGQSHMEGIVFAD